MKTYTLTEVQELLTDKEKFYEQQVQNPYPTESQSNTAYKKGFYEAWNYLVKALLPTEEVGIKEDDSLVWETFCDSSYYDLWAVRPIGDRDFNSQKLFHVQSMEEAYALRDILNSK